MPVGIAQAKDIFPAAHQSDGFVGLLVEVRMIRSRRVFFFESLNQQTLTEDGTWPAIGDLPLPAKNLTGTALRNAEAFP